MPLPGKEENDISQMVINLEKQQTLADVYIIKGVTIPAKSYVFLLIKFKVERKQSSAFLCKNTTYITG